MRPTKYKEEYCDEIVEYFKRAPLKQHLGSPNPPPTLYGFAASIGVCHDTLNEWKKHYPRFSAAIKRAKALQADFIIHNAMTGNAPAAFSIFMMKNIAGWKDKSEVEHSGSDNPVTINYVRKE